MSERPDPVLPDYQGGCIANVMPELVKAVMGGAPAPWIPPEVMDAKQVVLLVLDGLGWEQLQEHASYAPTLAGFTGGPITAVAPTTTVTGLSSIVIGRAPSVHRMLGYRMSVGDKGVLNVLQWSTNDNGQYSRDIDPVGFQTQPAFAANPVPAIIQGHVASSGFTSAHMQGANVIGYSMPSSLPVEVWRSVKSGAPFTYAYYGGIDTVAHAAGFGEHYDAELYTTDRLIRDLLAGMPQGTALVVTSDHGQVLVGDKQLTIDEDIVELCWRFSGEGRFRWLHARDERVDELAKLCGERYGELAWVKTKDELSDEGWFGGPLDDEARHRLGDVALIPFENVAFHDPHHGGERNMICRHGSLTSSEMLVPLLVHRV